MDVLNKCLTVDIMSGTGNGLVFSAGSSPFIVQEKWTVMKLAKVRIGAFVGDAAGCTHLN